MLLPGGNHRIWLCTEPTDMRKTFNGLSALVRNRLNDNPLDGSLYVFINRRRTQMRVLYFEQGGYALWAKRLERGQFAAPVNARGKERLSPAQLRCLIEGIEFRNARQYRRFTLDTSAQRL